MDKTYNAQAIERRCYTAWEQSGYFQPSGKGPAYSMVIPPPNVTGSLHMGHGFQQTLMDALVRFHRMQGNNTLWVVGTDHAGIATQMVVERQLAAKGESRTQLGREEFLNRVWQWKHTTDNTITQQIRRLGASVDWSRERFTMDDALSEAVIEVFVRLHDEGLIYRGKRLVNWDPKFQTAISDLEVVSEEEEGSLWYIRYPLRNTPSSYITVATTRPETMFGDVAIAVHPDDVRYQAFIGQTACIPIGQREIPIIADSTIDPEFGTGCVKITPAHDFNDYATGMRHHLARINIFTPDAHLNDAVPESYRGMDRFAARKKIVEQLTAEDLIEKITPHRLNVPRGDRSGVVIEPYLTDQWFVRTQPLAEPAIQAVREGRIRLIPEGWTKTYFNWMENIEDWCISRQLWWGHRIPAWYDERGQVYVGRSEAEVREKYQLSDHVVLHQDEDVLDTWFSSALWPFSTLGWPQPSQDLQHFFPTNVLVTGFDIIFFWVARMVMMSLKFLGDVPFKEVYVTGLIRDHEGQKMSKSKGNVLDPIDLIDGIDLESLLNKRTHESLTPKQIDKIVKATRKQFPNGIAAFGTDALRFTFCALATQGRDIQFDLGRIEGYRNFCNKLWNAARFVLMNCAEHDMSPIRLVANELSLVDRWILSRLQHTIQASHQYFANYRFDFLAQHLYEFLWNEYCDWYLEFTKPLLQTADPASTQAQHTRYCLLSVLEITLRLLHPIMPFITEEIWQTVYAKLQNKENEERSPQASIMMQAYPTAQLDLVDPLATQEVDWLKTIITCLRTIRSENNIAPQQAIEVCLRRGTAVDRERIQAHQPFIQSLGKVSHIRWLDTATMPPLAATALANDLEIFIPLEGIINLDQEIQRIQKNVLKLQKEQDSLQLRLNHSGVPEHILSNITARLAVIEQSVLKLNEQLARMELSRAQSKEIE